MSFTDHLHNKYIIRALFLLHHNKMLFQSQLDSKLACNIYKQKTALITEWEVQKQFQPVKILLQHLWLVVRQFFLFRWSRGSLENRFLRKQFLESDLAENFTTNVVRAVDSILKFLDFFLLWLKRYSLISFN